MQCPNVIFSNMQQIISQCSKVMIKTKPDKAVERYLGLTSRQFLQGATVLDSIAGTRN